MTLRAFIAVDFEARPALLGFLRELTSCGARLRVVPPENLHITLKFLGNTEEGMVQHVVDALEQSTEGVSAFTVSLTGTGAFPNQKSPRVVWVGVRDGDPLVTVARRLEERLQGLGFPREKRRFSPHLTVARVKGRQGKEDLSRVMSEYRDTEFGSQDVEAVVLKKSELRPTGAVYSEVALVRLA